ncbi:FAD-dependent oxidoreductase [Hydrogenophaga sp.]|uniref:FAD-dependent oxidoreductase n=1 Tax=Hydrogenophaga sp. TaxID=1904254 RepID=UPI0026272C5C|nr:FAD-dependent oxidoreductase [Hydrogenophaga sp.]MCW5655642.1 FAD-dependent oxidoreductase [Hydrogenophaga sp.]
MNRPAGRESYDVVVVGAGAGGAAAAIAAARGGARTLLIERNAFMGGAATQSQVLAYCGFFVFGDMPVRMVRGIGQEVLEELALLGLFIEPWRARSGAWIVLLDVEATKLAFDRLLTRSQVDLLLHTQLVDARRSGDRLEAVVVADYRGLREIEARCFVDASGHACLSSFAGVPLSQDGSPGQFRQPASLPIRIGGVPEGVEVDRERLARLVQAHNLTGKPRITREDGGAMFRLPLTGDYWTMAVDLDTDGVSGPDLARAETQAREMAWHYVQVLRQHPGFERATLLASGPQLGIRESRRPRSRRDVTEADALAGRRDVTGIARAAWPMEMHEAPGRAKWVALGGDGFFDVPHDAIVAEGLSNLRLAGRVIGADTRAYASVRVMGTAFATGQAAGVSAAFTADGDGGQGLAQRVRRELDRQGALV